MEIKVAARMAVNLQVRRKARPPANSLPCFDCGHVWEPGGKRHEYDHPRGYEGAAALDVEPVCKRCHVKRDNAKAAQTSCLAGHPFTPENTKRRSNGTRECRQCRRDRERKTRTAEWWRNRRKRVA